LCTTETDLHANPYIINLFKINVAIITFKEIPL